MTRRSQAPADRSQPQTLPAQGEDQQPAPRLPHERDESADSQANQVNQDPSARARGQLAHDDAQREIPDTTKGRELDETYDRLREGMPDGEKKKRSP
jgi:hypothetical protein